MMLGGTSKKAVGCERSEEGFVTETVRRRWAGGGEWNAGDCYEKKKKLN